ncbi:Tat-linked quality control protein TatD [uncultured archaeon]|nr:Tat-linked quality control protein TatD [uncultured archaeon]
MMQMLSDSHCHLDWFRSPHEVVERAEKAGVQKMLSCSTNRDSCKKNIGISEKFPAVKCALGIHPADLLKMGPAEAEKAFEFIEGNLGKAAAVGEVGLDFKYAAMPAQREMQEDYFRRFISLALENSKPISVHGRYAEPRCLEILRSEGAEKVHLHWFTNSEKNAKEAVSRGHFISCGPVILGDAHSAEVVKSIPLENLLLETDAPVPFSGAESEPSWIPRVCAKVAELKGIPAADVAKATGNNFSAFYG